MSEGDSGRTSATGDGARRAVGPPLLLLPAGCVWLGLPGCLRFGLAETAALRLPAMGVELSSYLLSSLPYVVVLLALVINHVAFPAKAAMPADLKSVFD